jgi:hypothetical protein
LGSPSAAPSGQVAANETLNTGGHPSSKPFNKPRKIINMNIKQSKLPMSPLLSATLISTSTLALTPYSTQAPTSVKESLPSYRISLKDADKWNAKYNCESLPLMHKDLFWKLLKDIT